MAKKTSSETNNAIFVTGLFKDKDSAECAYNALSARGYGKDAVDVVMSGETRDKYYAGGVSTAAHRVHAQPAFVREVPAWQRAAGPRRTHARGQIRVPFTPGWSWMSLVSEEKIYADGWIEDHGCRGNRLYVNRGIGFSVVPVRINCRPELTFFTLGQSSSLFPP